MQTVILSDLSVEELNIILNALGEQPAKNTIDIILKIREQANTQLSAATGVHSGEAED